MLNITTESQQPQPMRTGAEQFRIAGLDTCLLTVNAANGHHYVDGKGGKAILVREEWVEYRRLCAKYAAVPVDVPQAEDPFAEVPVLPAPLTVVDLRDIVTAMRVESQEVCKLVQGAQVTLSVEDYGDALQGAQRRLDSISSCLRELELRLNRQPEGLRV